MIKNNMKMLKLCTVLVTLLSCVELKAETLLSLDKAIHLSQQNDPWLQGSRLKQSAIENRSVAAGTFLDPKISIAMTNMAVDSWDFEQEAMTQLKVGIAQTFPRGESLAIKQNQLALASTRFPMLREDRKARIKNKVINLWLDVYLAQQTITLIDKDKALFEQIAEVAKASYANALGNTRQHDVIRAHLEMAKLEDRLMFEKQKQARFFALLGQWLHPYESNEAGGEVVYTSLPNYLSVSKDLPVISLNSAISIKQATYPPSVLAAKLAKHPLVLAIDIQQAVAKKGVSLAKQQYKPQWGLNASYGYRGDTPSNESRADLFSVGVSFDLPIFTQNRQDSFLDASIAESEAVKTEKRLLIKKMLSTLESEFKRYTHLLQRQLIYQQQLLTQTHEYAEASLTAYTNDDGDFSEVVNAKIAELNARISALSIDVDVLKTRARINYFFTHVDSKIQQQASHQDVSPEPFISTQFISKK